VVLRSRPTLSLPCAPIDAATPAIPSVESTSADQFLSSLGINVHIDQGYAAASYVQPLQYLGIARSAQAPGACTLLLRSRDRPELRAAIFANGGLVSDFLKSAKALRCCGRAAGSGGAKRAQQFPLTYKASKAADRARGSRSHISARCVTQLSKRTLRLPSTRFLVLRKPSENDTSACSSDDTQGVDTLLPAGTRFADFVALHNYVIGKATRIRTTKLGTQPIPVERAMGWALRQQRVTWRKSFLGYDKKDLADLPRVTTRPGG